MKPLTAFLCIMVTFSLVFSMAAFVLVAQNNGLFNPISTPSPTPIYTWTPPPSTNTPAPQITASPNTALTISYDETNREENNDHAKVTLTVTATYQSGNGITLNYNQFYLQLYIARNIYVIYEGTTNYPNTGTLTLGPEHTTQTFQLTYEYDTQGFNGMDTAPIYYQLQCNTTATISWTNQTYH